MDLHHLSQKILDNQRINEDEALALYSMPLPELGQLANARRKMAQYDKHQGRGNEIVTYVIDRNINYTNVCDVYCKFCAFYRTETDPDHYILTHDQIDDKVDELASVGGTQILLQGGHHPKLGIDFYIELLSHLKSKYPQINVHGFSPPEFNHFEKVFKMPLTEIIARFKEAGLGSIPGGGAEILVDRVRQRISPLKCSADDWLRVMETAHQQGLNSSATMMFGHVETLEERVQHLKRLREVQDRTQGFTAMICWTFQPGNTILQKAVPTKKGASEYLRQQAINRIYLDNLPNVQSSWVTQGPQVGQIALEFGANDFGNLMMEENVVSQAGTTFKLSLQEMRANIASAGYEPRQRNTWYELVDEPVLAV